MAALQFPEAGQASAYGVGQASACQWQAPEAGLPWQEALDFCDRFSLTLVFGAAAGDTLPGWVRKRIAGDLGEDTERLERARALQHQVSQGVTPARIPQ